MKRTHQAFARQALLILFLSAFYDASLYYCSRCFSSGRFKSTFMYKNSIACIDIACCGQVFQSKKPQS
jgi:hypothetical protein